MKLIAQRPCSFGGKRFFIGDEIPAEYVVDPAMQEKMGVLMQIDAQDEPNPSDGPAPSDNPSEPKTIPIIIHAKEGDLPLDITVEGLQAVVDVMTGTAEDAEPTIADMTDGDALILLHIADSRKTIKSAAEARAKELNAEESDNAEESEGEQ